MKMSKTVLCKRSGRHASAGQTLLIFALVAVVLFGIVGLAVDAGMSYLTAAGADRAASAAVLSAVVEFDGTPTGLANAKAQALLVAQSNGVPNSDVTVSEDCTLAAGACYSNRLMVTVSENAPVSFLSLLGFGSHKVTETEEAEYRSPIGLGQAGSSLGADDTDLGLSSATSYMEVLEQWGFGRQNGDAFNPNPYVNWPSGPVGGDVDEHILNGEKGTDQGAGVALPGGDGNTYLARGGNNFLLYVPPGQTVQAQVYQPIFAATAPPTWYAEGPGGLQRIHEGNAIGCSLPDLHVSSPPADIAGPYCVAPGSDWTHDPTKYMSLRYTIFPMASPYDFSQSASSSVIAQPIDAYNGPQANGGSGFDPWTPANSYVNIATGAVVAGTYPTGYREWVNIGDPALGTDPSSLYYTDNAMFPGASTLSGGAKGAYYRLRVDLLTTDGSDPSVVGYSSQTQSEDFAVRLANVGLGIPPSDKTDGPLSAVQQCGGCSVEGLNDMSYETCIDSNFFPDPAVQVVDIPSDYAGQSVNVDLFDPGDLSPSPPLAIPSVSLSLIRPDGTTATLLSAVNLGPALNGSQGCVNPQTGASLGSCPPVPIVGNSVAALDPSGNALYNGEWLQFTVQVPVTDSSGNPYGGGYWSLKYDATNALTNDALTVLATSVGSPVHLLPQPY